MKNKEKLQKNTLTEICRRDIIQKRARNRGIFPHTKIITTAKKPHRTIYGEINREVKWNANIQQLVKKKDARQLLKSTALPALQRTYNSLRKESSWAVCTTETWRCAAVKTATLKPNSALRKIARDSSFQRNRSNKLHRGEGHNLGGIALF